LPLGSISYKLDSFVFSVIAISLLSLAAAALSFSVSKDVLSPEAVSYLEEDSVIECSVAIPAISSFSVVSLTEIFSSWDSSFEIASLIISATEVEISVLIIDSEIFEWSNDIFSALKF